MKLTQTPIVLSSIEIGCCCILIRDQGALYILSLLLQTNTLEEVTYYEQITTFYCCKVLV